MFSKNIIPKTVNPDLKKEREGANFSSEEFAAWWAGGKEKLEFNRSVRKLKIFSYMNSIYKNSLFQLECL